MIGRITKLCNVKSGKVLTNLGKSYTFTIRTKIIGCKYKHLEVNDVVFVRLNRLNRVKEIEICNIEAKWERILLKDKKLKHIKNLESGKFIKPEVIESQSKHYIKHQEKISKYLDEHKFKYGRYKKIMEFYNQGKSLSYIARKLGYKSRDGVHYIIKKHLKLWGIK